MTTINLVGSYNNILAVAVARSQAHGMLGVAAGGNDGPAAQPAYPASYRGVLAVTEVDAKNRTLPEAGRALHVDFAVPGDGVLAATGLASTDRLRGTIGTAVDGLVLEARDLGKPGRDRIRGTAGFAAPAAAADRPFQIIRKKIPATIVLPASPPFRA